MILAEMDQESSHGAHRSKLPGNVKVLGLASLLNDIASEMIFPLLPGFLITVLGGNRIHLGVIEGIADSVSSLLRLWAGAWSDRVRWRKGFVVIGYALAAVARPLAGIAILPWHLFAIRTVDRIGKGIRTAPRDALITESTDPAVRGRAFGFHQAMDHLGAAIGPVLATLFLLAWPGQLRLLFLLTLIPGMIVVGLVGLGLRESGPKVQLEERPQLTHTPLGRGFRHYLFALVIFTLGNSSDAFLLVRAGELGVSAALLPLLWCAFHIVKSCANLLAGNLADRFGPRVMVIAGWAIYAVIYFAFAAANTAWQVWIIFLSYGFVFSLSEPAQKSLVARLAPGGQKGAAFGWFHFAVGVAALPSSLIFGWLYERLGAFTAFGWGAVLAAIAALLLLCLPRNLEPQLADRT